MFIIVIFRFGVELKIDQPFYQAFVETNYYIKNKQCTQTLP